MLVVVAAPSTRSPLVCTYRTVPQAVGSTLRCDVLLTSSRGTGRIRAYLLAWGDLVTMRKQLLTFAALSEKGETCLPQWRHGVP